ncbi:hypothetical protein M0R45_008710 [Rubus argutus]|uniref:Uncharacterized protein n=1 Tax=Rubus argutus TaxID=59490 RepID=A0AAW1Y2G4_RUBAR
MQFTAAAAATQGRTCPPPPPFFSSPVITNQARSRGVVQAQEGQRATPCWAQGLTAKPAKEQGASTTVMSRGLGLEEREIGGLCCDSGARERRSEKWRLW